MSIEADTTKGAEWAQCQRIYTFNKFINDTCIEVQEYLASNGATHRSRGSADASRANDYDELSHTPSTATACGKQVETIDSP
jgi:hypothetical protein